MTNPSPRNPSRPLLTYFGGKWAIAPWIIEHLPPHKIYVEPFGGAASVLLRKPRSKVEVYNDLDDEIVNIFRVLQDPASTRELFRRLARTPYARAEYDLACAERVVDPVIRAQRAIIRANMAFHHEAFFNLRYKTFADAKHRGGGSNLARTWCTRARALASIAARMRGVIIDNRPARDVIRVQDSEHTLFYVDPPYVPASRSHTRYRCDMTQAEHVELLTQLRAVRGFVALSGYPSDLYDSALADWQRFERKTHAHMSRRPRTEVLWLNPRAADALSSTQT